VGCCALVPSRLIGPNDAQCPERAALAKELVETTAFVYKAKREYDDLRASKPAFQGDLRRLVEALNNARNRARAAQHAFEEHVAVHHCTA
jgi:hypothetical protein